jgi:hypothetical protein
MTPEVQPRSQASCSCSAGPDPSGKRIRVIRWIRRIRPNSDPWGQFYKKN